MLVSWWGGSIAIAEILSASNNFDLLVKKRTTIHRLRILHLCGKFVPGVGLADNLEKMSVAQFNEIVDAIHALALEKG